MDYISCAGYLLASVGYKGKTGLNATQTTFFGGNRVQTGFSLSRILQMLANILRMKCSPFFALLRDY